MAVELGGLVVVSHVQVEVFCSLDEGSTLLANLLLEIEGDECGNESEETEMEWTCGKKRR